MGGREFGFRNVCQQGFKEMVLGGEKLNWVAGELQLKRHAKVIAWVRGISERSTVNSEVFEGTAE